MPRFSLRTLILVMLLGGPVLAGQWWVCKAVVPPDGHASVLFGLPWVAFLALVVTAHIKGERVSWVALVAIAVLWGFMCFTLVSPTVPLP
jgi:hypothetical protein